MENKYIYENILTLTKTLITLYINGAVESSNKEVRKFMESGLDNALTLQDELYQTMSQDGFYSTCNVKESEINKLYNKLTKDEN